MNFMDVQTWRTHKAHQLLYYESAKQTQTTKIRTHQQQQSRFVFFFTRTKKKIRTQSIQSQIYVKQNQIGLKLPHHREIRTRQVFVQRNST